MYKYCLNENNEIYGELVNQPLTEVGYFDGRWHSEEQLSYMNPDGSFKYKIVPAEPQLETTTGLQPIAVKVKHELIENDFDIVSYEKPLLTAKVKSMCRAVIENYDWKMIRHKEQKDLISLGEDLETSLTDEEYINILKAKQNLRSLSNIGEKMVNNISSIDGLQEAYPLFDYDFSDTNVVKSLLEAWSQYV